MDAQTERGSLSMRLAGYGKAQKVVTGSRIEYRRDGVVEWYQKLASGIEQNGEAAGHVTYRVELPAETALGVYAVRLATAFPPDIAAWAAANRAIGTR